MNVAARLFLSSLLALFSRMPELVLDRSELLNLLRFDGDGSLGAASLDEFVVKLGSD
jgi:hypothetical protein